MPKPLSPFTRLLVIIALATVHRGAVIAVVLGMWAVPLG